MTQDFYENVQEQIDAVETLIDETKQLKDKKIMSMRNFGNFKNRVDSNLQSVESALRVFIHQKNTAEQEFQQRRSELQEEIEGNNYLRALVNAMDELIRHRDVIASIQEQENEYLRVVNERLSAIVNHERQTEVEREVVKAMQELKSDERKYLSGLIETHREFNDHKLRKVEIAIGNLVDIIRYRLPNDAQVEEQLKNVENRVQDIGTSQPIYQPREGEDFESFVKRLTKMDMNFQEITNLWCDAYDTEDYKKLSVQAYKIQNQMKRELTQHQKQAGGQEEQPDETEAGEDVVEEETD